MTEIQKKRLEEKYKEQRTEKGYSEADVWNLCGWLSEIVPKMLKELAENHQGFPASIEREYFEEHKKELFTQDYRKWTSYPNDPSKMEQREYADKVCDEKWTETLKEMAFLLSELNDETCSWDEDEMSLNNNIKKQEYQNQCKERFMELFDKHFWDLWD